jgi:hypothetical protein
LDTRYNQVFVEFHSIYDKGKVEAYYQASPAQHTGDAATTTTAAMSSAGKST